ncbi:hypothetical protein VOLCADRAFT_95113 [Volvox carteri f. nagariensis]|uniref:Uncharacterized protein n=1 Tax=Volvox carteri f. nagariensis TaxID=3068 RepID=D8U6M5_VOLCA|nr:uncharacterized protein VOLCADRAFT_95113 [Volvox carteri f. nagariensis]EFJ44672.1 hypothetical protein VOLCADRAFT_95113 [Volvox carteri f. nagariensis]|eukprot:XP_002954248.1 hypothetical protein VOLCADRAFT_95113 [Volvox carteri f. nagariensis]
MADVGGASGKPPKGKRESSKDTYTYNGKEYSAREFYEKLKDSKRNSRASWWAFFNVVLVNNAVKLACAFCPTQLKAIAITRRHIGQVLKVQRALDAHFAEFDKQNPDMMVKPRGNMEAVAEWRGQLVSAVSRAQQGGKEREDARKLAAEVYAGNGEGATEEDRRADKDAPSLVHDALCACAFVRWRCTRKQLTAAEDVYVAPPHGTLWNSAAMKMPDGYMLTLSQVTTVHQLGAHCLPPSEGISTLTGIDPGISRGQWSRCNIWTVDLDLDLELNLELFALFPTFNTGRARAGPDTISHHRVGQSAGRASSNLMWPASVRSQRSQRSAEI